MQRRRSEEHDANLDAGSPRVLARAAPKPPPHPQLAGRVCLHSTAPQKKLARQAGWRAVGCGDFGRGGELAAGFCKGEVFYRAEMSPRIVVGTVGVPWALRIGPKGKLELGSKFGIWRGMGERAAGSRIMQQLAA